MSIAPRSLPPSARRAELLAKLIAILTEGGPDTPPLGLHDRGSSDPTVALLDAWATAGDVIGFYLDRIANEGYAATAQEPGSVLALAGMLGHEPRPGLAATLHVAYTLQTDLDDKAVLLPAGLLSQSVPGPGEQPQTFETAAPLLTRPSWNALPVKATKPLTLPKTGAAALPELVVAGTTGPPAANDVILLSTAAGGDPVVVRVQSATTDQKAKLTTIALQADKPSNGPHPAPGNTIDAIDALAPGLSARPVSPPPSASALDRGPSTVFAPGSDAVPRLLAALKPELAQSLYGALASTLIGTPAVTSAAVLRANAAPFGAQAPPRRLFDDRGQPAGTEELPIEDVHALEFQISVDSLVELFDKHGKSAGPGLERLQGTLRRVRESVPGQVSREPVVDVICDAPAGSARSTVVLTGTPRWPADLGALGAVMLTASGTGLKMSYTSSDPSRLPALEVTSSFDPTHSSIVISFPDGQQYSWDPSMGTSVRVSLGDRRLGISWPVEPGSTGPSALSIRIATPLAVADPTRLALDKSYDTILPGSYVVIDGAQDALRTSSIAYPVVAKVLSASSAAVSRHDLTAKVTELQLDKPWIGDEKLLSAVRGLSVRAQPDTLALAPVDITTEVKDDQIELEGLVAGMEPGHLILVTGMRSDLPGGTSVTGGEVAMVANLSQGAAADGEEPHTTLQLAAKLTFSYVRSTVTIYGNITPAHQGSTIQEVLGSGTPSERRQSFTLSSAPLLADAADGPGGGKSTLSVRVDGVACDEVDRFYSDTPPRSFVTGLDSRGHTTITFAGPLPPGNGNVAASYRAGDGSLGNLRPGQLTQLLSRPLGVTGVTNPLPGEGGSAPDGPGQVRDVLPAGLRSLGRIVSVSDSADFARSWANVGKATARIVSDSGSDAVLVTVAGNQPVAISQTLCASIAGAAASSRDLVIPVRVLPADMLTIVLVAGVTRDPRYDWDTVADGVRAALLRQLGYANRALSEDVVLSEVIAAAHRTPGVLAFTVSALALVPATATAGELADKLPKLLTAGDPVPAVIDVGDANSAWGDGSAPGGLEPDAIAYLDPTVPDTLLLTEVTP